MIQKFITVAGCGTIVLVGSACATAPPHAQTANYGAVATSVSSKARLYADCIAEAAENGRYGYAYDGLHVVVFTCEGSPARAFYEALGPWTDEIGSEVVDGERTLRPTTRIERDLFGADYCETIGPMFRCAITLRTGEFTQPD